MVSCNIYGNTGLGLAPLCPRHNFALLPHPTPPTCLFVAYLPWGLVQGLYTGGGQLRWVQACCLTPVHSNTQPRTPTHIPTQRPPIVSCVSPLPRTTPAAHLVVHKQKQKLVNSLLRYDGGGGGGASSAAAGAGGGGGGAASPPPPSAAGAAGAAGCPGWPGACPRHHVFVKIVQNGSWCKMISGAKAKKMS